MSTSAIGDEESSLQHTGEDETPSILTKPDMNGEAITNQEPSDASVLSASELPDIVPTPTQAESQTSNEPTSNEPTSNEPTSSKDEASLDNDWVDILGNQQLMKKVIRNGGGVSTRPTPQSRVKVSARGCLESGEVVDKHKTFVFTVGDGDVIQALDLSVTLMETGELSEVKSGPRFAFGSSGREPDVPPNATLLYEVELLEVLGPLDYQTISQEELLAAVDKKRVRGNELFKRQEFDRAVTSYQRGLQMLKSYIEEHAGEGSKEIQDMEIRCWNNVAAAQLKVEMYKEVLVSCGHVLDKDPDNVKALFRSGKVLSQQGEMDDAVKRLQRAAGINPEEKAIKQELARAVQKRDHMKEKEKAMYRRMVEGKPSTKSDKSKPKQGAPSWGPLPYLTAAMVVAAIGIGMAYFITQRH